MTTARVLSKTNLANFQRDGYVVLPAVFAEAELAKLRAESDRLTDFLVNASFATGEVSPRLDLRRAPNGPVCLKIQPLSDVSELFAQVANDRRLLNPMRELLGCEPVLLEEKLNGKELLVADLQGLRLRRWAPEFPWHTDLHYFFLDGYPETTLSSAIALDDCTAENGPLRFVPGSHHRQDWPIRDTWPPDLASGVINDSDAEPLICAAGTVVIFHSRVVHASSPNRTKSPRRLLIYSHFPETSQMPPDARNAPLREAGRAHERSYANALASGYRPRGVRACS